jgi:peptidoglycan/xylan/chitin deacetylase (PgdA/CDA1 family)
MMYFLRAIGLAGVGIVAVFLSGAMLSGNAANTGAARPSPVQGQSPETIVTLTFDDAYQNQWRYAVPLLRSHHMSGTFYVITADSDGPYPCCMSWAQLRILQGQGDDIGSHTVDHARLTTLIAARVSQEVCESRLDMLRHGIDDPESFAYPFGSFNPASEKLVAQCGFTNSRQGGGISSSNVTPGPPWAETLPPKFREAVRTIAVDGAYPIRLADLEKYVTGVAAHGGGWLPITFHDVCDVYAPDFIHCMSTYGPVQDTVLGHFLDWLRNAGHSGGAPAGVVVHTMRWAANTTNGPDTTAPRTTVRCNNAPCQAAYVGPVTVNMSAADPGGVGVARTYVTTDGSTPNTGSGVYQTPLIVQHTEMIKFFSVDNAGNQEKVKTVTIKVGPHP